MYQIHSNRKKIRPWKFASGSMTAFILLVFTFSEPAHPAGPPATGAEMTVQHNMIKQKIEDAQTAIQASIGEVKSLVETLDGGAPHWGAGTEGQRFVVNGPEVCDNTTGLHWQQSPSGSGGFVWSSSQGSPSAIDYCATLDLGNGEDYRLPEIKELVSLVDYSQFNPSLPGGHPFTVVSATLYWSATSAQNPQDTINAWTMETSNGEVNQNAKAGGRDVWCVR